MFTAITYIYQSENIVYPDKNTGKMMPCQLYVTMTSAIVSKEKGDINCKYKKVGVVRHSK